jgi:hypothetical protein
MQLSHLPFAWLKTITLLSRVGERGKNKGKRSKKKPFPFRLYFFSKKCIHNFCKRSIEGYIVRKQLIVKPDEPGGQFMALISDRLNIQITGSGIKHPNQPKVTQSEKHTVENLVILATILSQSQRKPQIQKNIYHYRRA